MTPTRHTYLTALLLLPLFPLWSCLTSKKEKTEPPVKIEVRYTAFILKNYRNSEFFVPDSESAPVNCEKITPTAINFEKSLGVDPKKLVAEKLNCLKSPVTCSHLQLKGKVSNRESWGILKSPLLTLERWSALFPQYPIVINTAFFEVEFLDGWPHEMPCTNVFGLIKTSGGYYIGNDSKNYPLDYFVINKTSGGTNIKFVAAEDFTHHIGAQASAMANGFILAKNGAMAFKSKKPKENPAFSGLGYPNQRNGRMIIGLSENDLYIFNVENRDKEKYGATYDEISQIALRDYPVRDLFAFDSGGSAMIFAKKSAASSDYIYKTPPSDAQGYRPIPAFLGIRPADMSAFSQLH